MLSGLLTRGTAFLLDVCILLGTIVVGAIVATGGTDITLGRHLVRVHSVGNPLVILLSLAAIRFLARRWAPLLLVASWHLDDLELQARAIVHRLHARMRAMDQRAAWRLVLGLAAVVITLKVLNAWRHFGFVTGDDVEIEEMTFAYLFHWDWRAWELRSAFYPMTFVLPVQKVLVAVGVTETTPLVFAGRTVVAVLSTVAVPLLYRIGQRLFGRGVGLLAAGILACSGLLLAFGSTELPRPISMVFVLGAFGCLAEAGSRRAAFAGALIGIGAAMRFSELVFVAPAAAHLVIERRWRDGLTLMTAAAAVGCGIQAISDALYWGQPFASFLHIFDFTVVQGLSSRGYEPMWHYATTPAAWSDPVVVGLAIYGSTRRNWRPALWTWLPIALLSLLPHKEPRYLVPVIPFLALTAALGVQRIVARVEDSDASRVPPARRPVALALIALLAASFVFQVHVLHRTRSEPEVELARALNARGDVEVLAVEQAWMLGGRLYLRQSATVIDLDPDFVARDGALATVVSQSAPRWMAIRRPTCQRVDCSATLHLLGYQEVSPGALPDSGYRIFHR